MNILVINGPNLNMLGIREPNIYGKETYQDLENYLKSMESEFNISIEVYQSNYEGDIITKLHDAYFKKIDRIIINPGAFTHYSYSIYDAIKSIGIKTIEVHLSDITKREEFRKISVIRDSCYKSFYGKGFLSYRDAILSIIGEDNEISNKL